MSESDLLEVLWVQHSLINGVRAGMIHSDDSWLEVSGQRQLGLDSCCMEGLLVGPLGSVEFSLWLGVSVV